MDGTRYRVIILCRFHSKHVIDTFQSEKLCLFENMYEIICLPSMLLPTGTAWWLLSRSNLVAGGMCPVEFVSNPLFTINAYQIFDECNTRGYIRFIHCQSVVLLPIECLTDTA